MLFNLALIGLPPKLQEIDGSNHTIYAHDITLWVSDGNDRHVENTLQHAIEAVEQYPAGTGLACSAEKSELLIYIPSRHGRKPRNYEERNNPEIYLTTADGTPTPKVDKIRVLWLIIESSSYNGDHT